MKNPASSFYFSMEPGGNQWNLNEEPKTRKAIGALEFSVEHNHQTWKIAFTTPL